MPQPGEEAWQPLLIEKEGELCGRQRQRFGGLECSHSSPGGLPNVESIVHVGRERLAEQIVEHLTVEPSETLAPLLADGIHIGLEFLLETTPHIAARVH